VRRPKVELVETAQLVDPNALVREVFPLTSTDLQMLHQEGPDHSVRPLKHVRAFHHTIAIALAVGRREGEIAADLQMHPSTISNLKQSPQFNELVEAYQGQAGEETFKLIPLMSTIGAEVLHEMHERLLDDEARRSMSVTDLKSIFTEMADRIGHSPVRRSEAKLQTQGGLSPDDITALRDALREDALETAIDVTPTQGQREAQESGPVGDRTLAIVRTLGQSKTSNANSTPGQTVREEVPAIRTTPHAAYPVRVPEHNPAVQSVDSVPGSTGNGVGEPGPGVGGQGSSPGVRVQTNPGPGGRTGLVQSVRPLSAKDLEPAHGAD